MHCVNNNYIEDFPQFSLIEKNDCFSARFEVPGPDIRCPDEMSYCPFTVDVPKDGHYPPARYVSRPTYQFHYFDSSIIIIIPNKIIILDDGEIPNKKNCEHRYSKGYFWDDWSGYETIYHQMPTKELNSDEAEAVFDEYLKVKNNVANVYETHKEYAERINKLYIVRNDRKHLQFMKDEFAVYLYNIKPENLSRYYNIVYKSLKVIPLKKYKKHIKSYLIYPDLPDYLK